MKIKKTILGFLVCLFAISACSCGQSNKTTTNSGLVFTDEMIEEIESDIEEDKSIGLNGPQLRAFSYAVTKKDITVTKVDITSYGLEDDYRYMVYGKVYGKDSYNDTVAYKFRMSYTAQADDESEKGYKLTSHMLSMTQDN